MAKTPFESGYKPLEPIGKYILVEIVQDDPAKEKKVGSIIVAQQQKANLPQFGLVLKVGNKVEAEISEGDFIEVNGQWYPAVVDSEGFGRFQLVHEEQLAGVYRKK